MKTLSTVLLALLCVAYNGTMAHPGHDHELTKEQALLRGRTIVSSLVDNQKLVTGEALDDSWKQASESATCKETPEFYLIAIDNRGAGKTLYLLLTSGGKYLRGNFDGEFADLIFSPYPVQSC